MNVSILYIDVYIVFRDYNMIDKLHVLTIIYYLIHIAAMSEVSKSHYNNTCKQTHSHIQTKQLL